MPADELAIDYGTSNTVAVVRSADGRVRPLLFDGSPLLPSAVQADGGRLLAGKDAMRAARVDPARHEPNPKRRIDDLEVLLGDRAFAVTALVAATLRRVADEAVRALGGPPARVVVTHPVAWGPARREVLAQACVAAGLPAPAMVAETVAAATYYATALERPVPVGHAVVVYDLGAGTFDVTVVHRTVDGFEVLASRGVDDLGGLDLDALVVAHAQTTLGPGHTDAWRRITAPADPESRRHHRLLWDDARDAKEALSRRPWAEFHVPALGVDVRITRGEYEALVRPLLARTVDVTVATMRESRVPTDRIAGLFLVGGASRTPLVATLLHQETGIAPTVLDHPELVVAEGALCTVAWPAAAVPPVELRPEAPPAETPEPVETPEPADSAEFRPRLGWLAFRWAVLLLVGAALSAVGAVGAYHAAHVQGTYSYQCPEWTLPTATASPTWTYSPTPTPSASYVCDFVDTYDLVGWLSTYAAVGALLCAAGVALLARSARRRRLRVSATGLEVRLGPFTPQRAVAATASVAGAAAFGTLAYVIFDQSWRADLATDEGLRVGYVVLAVGGLVLGCGAIAAWRIVRSRRTAWIRVDGTGAEVARADNGERVATYPWAELTEVSIRPVGWRRSRTLLATPKPGSALLDAARPGPEYLRRRGAFRVLDLGRSALPVAGIGAALARYSAGRLSPVPTAPVPAARPEPAPTHPSPDPSVFERQR